MFQNKFRIVSVFISGKASYELIVEIRVRAAPDLMIDAVALFALASLVMQTMRFLKVFRLGLVFHPQAVGRVIVVAAARLVQRVLVGFQFENGLIKRLLDRPALEQVMQELYIEFLRS